MMHRMLAVVFLAAARAQNCEDGQTCSPQHVSPNDMGILMQMKSGSASVSHAHAHANSSSIGTYVEQVVNKVTALGGSHQGNVELAKEEVRKLALQLAADPNYTVFNMSQSGMQQAFQRIIDEMEEVINDTLVSLDKDHKEFDIMIANIRKCGLNLAASNVSVTEMSPAVMQLGLNHDVCRNVSVALRDANHSAQVNYYGHMTNANIPDCAQNFAPGTCPATQDYSLEAFYDNAIACAASVDAWAGPFHTTATSLRSTHEAAERAVIAKYQECDQAQLTYELGFCTYRTELIDACSALDNCYSSAVDVFQKTKELILKSNTSRHVAFIAARQVQCYVRVLQTDNLTMAAIEACDFTKVDTSPLKLTVPSVPGKPACDVSLVAQHPCGAAWVAKHYQDSSKYWVAQKMNHRTCMPCLDQGGTLQIDQILPILESARPEEAGNSFA